MSIGEVMQEAFGLYRRFLWRFIAPTGAVLYFRPARLFAGVDPVPPVTVSA